MAPLAAVRFPGVAAGGAGEEDDGDICGRGQLGGRKERLTADDIPDTRTGRLGGLGNPRAQPGGSASQRRLWKRPPGPRGSWGGLQSLSAVGFGFSFYLSRPGELYFLLAILLFLVANMS